MENLMKLHSSMNYTTINFELPDNQIIVKEVKLLYVHILCASAVKRARFCIQNSFFLNGYLYNLRAINYLLLIILKRTTDVMVTYESFRTIIRFSMNEKRRRNNFRKE